MNYDSTRQLRLAGLITEDYRGTIDNETNNLNENENDSELEQQLRNHIRAELQDTVTETRLRNKVRKEIRNMLDHFQQKQLGGWILSGNKVKKLRSNSNKGQVTIGFTGFGFK